MKRMLMATVVVAGLTLSACGWSSSGSLDAAAPTANGSIGGDSQNGMVKGSTAGDSAPLTADQVDQRAQDRCLELGGEVPADPQMDRESAPVFSVPKMPGIRQFFQCAGERTGGTACAINEFNQVAFQRAKVNGGAELLRCSVGNGGLFWLRIESFPVS